MSLILKYGIAACIRFMLLNSKYMQTISDRIEISTPLNSWKRILEGTYLYEHVVDPYDGDLFHESPLILVSGSYLLKHFPGLLSFIFITLDLLTAFCLAKTAELFMHELMQKQGNNKSSYSKDIIEQLLIKDSQFKIIPVYVATCYLFNPYTILSCAGMATAVLANLFLALTFFGMIYGSRILSCVSLAMASIQSLYPAILLFPIIIYINQKSSSRVKCSALRTLIIYFVCVAALLYISSLIVGSWKFIHATYGFILNVPDLRPNVGLFWYFFTEMFEHFRPLFICAFQINATFLYLLPLSLRLKHEPMLLATSLAALIAIFKSYPGLGDVGFYLALLPMWKHLFYNMQQGFIVGCFFIVTSVLGPTVWHLWIYSKSANANFFFGVTLAFATAQIFLVTDILFAYIKREYTLKSGLKRILKGKPAKLALE